VRLIADRNPELFNIPTYRGVGGKRFPLFHFRIWRRDTLAGYLRKLLLDWRGLKCPRLEEKPSKRKIAHISGEIGFILVAYTSCRLSNLERPVIERRAS
jgi:hypothetical protein